MLNSNQKTKNALHLPGRRRLLLLFFATVMAFSSTKVNAQCSCTEVPGAPNLAGPRSSFPTIPAAGCMTDYTSDYAPTTCTGFPNAGEYTEGEDAGLRQNVAGGTPKNQWCGVDHTSGMPGNGSGFLMANGFDDAPNHTAPNTCRVWKRPVAVIPGHTYTFKCWVIRLCNTPSVNPEEPTVQLAIGTGTNFDILTSVDLPYPCGGFSTCCDQWQQICGSWTAPECGPTNIELAILLPAKHDPVKPGSGNDIGIDDISFTEIVPATADAGFTFTRLACNKEIPFLSNDQSGAHTWDFGDGHTSTDVNPSHKYDAPGIYAVMHTVKNGSCGNNGSKSLPLTVESCCSCNGNADPMVNLVKDGDFSEPCGIWPRWYESDFAQDFPCGPTHLVPSGWDHFVQTNTTVGGGRPYCNLLDHTHNPTRGTDFLIVDAGVTAPAERRAWYQDGPLPGVTGEGYEVTQGQTYCFKVSVNNPNFQHPQKSSIKLVIKGCNKTYTVATIDYIEYNDKCGWTTICGCWTAECSHIDELAIWVYANDCDQGNDFAIDDIIFSPTETPCNQGCDAQSQHDIKGWQLEPVIKDPSKTQPADKENNDLLNLEQHPEDAAELNVNPIPVQRGVDMLLTYETKSGDNIQVQILDAQGKMVSSMNKQLLPGKNEMTLKTDMLTPGTYIVKTIAGSNVRTKKIIVQ
jgi:hypothetical protein